MNWALFAKLQTVIPLIVERVAALQNTSGAEKKAAAIDLVMASDDVHEIITGIDLLDDEALRTLVDHGIETAYWARKLIQAPGERDIAKRKEADARREKETRADDLGANQGGLDDAASDGPVSAGGRQEAGEEDGQEAHDPD